MRSPPTLNLPAALVRFWPGRDGDDRQALAAAAELAELPGCARLAERLFAILPVDGRISVFDFAVRWSSELRARLLAAGLEERISGILVFPCQVAQGVDGLAAAGEFLLEDLDRQRPFLSTGELFLTSYAARWLRGRYRFERAELYSGPSGRRVPLFRLAGEEAEPLPWHNHEVLGRRVYVERPAVAADLAAAARVGSFRVRGALGAGKSHAVWHFLHGRRSPVVWIGVGRALPGTSRLGRRLLDELRRLVPEGPPDAAPAGETPRMSMAQLLDRLQETVDRLAAAGDRAGGEAIRPWVVCDVFQTVTEADLDFLSWAVAAPDLRDACRWILISRTGKPDPPAVAHLPEVAIPPLDALESASHRDKLLAGLGMNEETIAQLGEMAAGNPLVLEEGLVGLVHQGRIRRVYGSFFFDGGEIAYEPSQRWIRQVESEVRRLGEPLPLRILAAAGRATPASHLELAAVELGVEPGADWQQSYLAAGWLTAAETSWGPGLEFSSEALACGLRATIAGESMSDLRHALGRVMAADRRTASGDWHAYELLAGSPEALPPLLDFSRDSGDRLSREELFDALLSEYRLHRERHGDAATELDLLWSLLPLSQNLGHLPTLEPELQRAIELAADNPRRHVALLALEADFHQEKGQFRKAEEVLRRALTASEGIDETRRAAIFIRLGDLLMRDGRLKEARELFESLLDVVERAERTALVATCQFHLGNVALREKRFQDALDHHEKACGMRRKRQLAKPLGASLSALGAVHLALGDYPRALTYYREAEEVIGEHGHAGELAFAQRGAGRVLDLLGDHLAATKPLRRALEAREGRDVVGEALARLDLAANQLELGNFDQALAEARQAHFRLSLTPETALLGDAEQLLGRILRRQHQDGEARQHFAEARRLHLKHGDRGAAAIDCSLLLELAIEGDERQDVLAYGAELEGLLKELIHPTFGEVLYFRLYRAFDWLRRRQIPVHEPGVYLRRAYRELMRKTAFLSPELRHAFLYQIREHQDLLDTAARQNISFPGI